MFETFQDIWGNCTTTRDCIPLAGGLYTCIHPSFDVGTSPTHPITMSHKSHPHNTPNDRINRKYEIASSSLCISYASSKSATQSKGFLNFPIRLWSWTPIKATNSLKLSSISKRSSLLESHDLMAVFIPPTDGPEKCSEQAGRPAAFEPPEYTMKEIYDNIPPHCLQPNTLVSLYYILRDYFFVLVMVSVARQIPNISYPYLRSLAWATYAFLQGLVFTGKFCASSLSVEPILISIFRCRALGARSWMWPWRPL